MTNNKKFAIILNQAMTYKIQKGLIVQKIDDKTVIFDAEESILYTLNETAAYIFQKLKRGFDKEKIIDQMAKRYPEVKKERLNKDFDELIGQLKKKKIIKQILYRKTITRI